MANLSLRAELVALLLVEIMPLVLFTGLWVQGYERDHIRRFEAHVREQTRTLAKDIDLAGLSASLQTLATSTSIPAGDV